MRPRESRPQFSEGYLGRLGDRRYFLRPPASAAQRLDHLRLLAVPVAKEPGLFRGRGNGFDNVPGIRQVTIADRGLCRE